MNHLEIARYAYENVPFYQNIKEIDSEKWEDIPLISKEKLLEEMDQNLAPEYIMDYLRGDLELIMTSGSTGMCLNVYWDKGQNKKSMLPLWLLRKKYYNIMPNDKRCFFFTTKMIEGKQLEREQTRYGMGFGKIGLTEQRLRQIYQEIKEYEPKWFLMQPSMVMLLLHVAKQYDLGEINSLKYIELTGERIHKGVKEQIKNFFQCPVASQYGCYEMNSIAYECPEGHMHVMEENVYVEVLGKDDIPVYGKEGKIYVTSLQNKVMPFVRYGIGDVGIIYKEYSCPCGNSAPIIELTAARDNDYIQNADGSRISSDIFCHAIERLNLYFGHCVDQYQIVQVNDTDFDIYWVLDRECEVEHVRQMFVDFLEEFGCCHGFRFHETKYLIPSEETGKLAWFCAKC